MLNYYSPKSHIYSVLNNCDLKSAMTRVIDYFDPNKSVNRKTRVLDKSISYVWTEPQLKLYGVDKTRNISGSVRNKRFDMILYEPPRNRKFHQDAKTSSKIFKKLINKNGSLIVKINDFKEKGSDSLRGSFEMWDIFSQAGFYIHDNIVYAFNNYNRGERKLTNRAEIIHLYFMVFKVC